MRKGLLTPLLALAVLGSAAPAAHASLGWDVSAHSFPQTDVGISSPPRTFTLTATCDAGMAGLCNSPPAGFHLVNGVDAPGADFNVDSTTCGGSLLTVAFPGTDTCTATVAFKPSGPGLRSGILTTGTSVQVVLNGTGIDPAANGGGNGGSGKKCKKKKGKNSAEAAKKKKKCKKKGKK
jgi:hypothetical protein